MSVIVRVRCWDCKVEELFQIPEGKCFTFRYGDPPVHSCGGMPDINIQHAKDSSDIPERFDLGVAETVFSRAILWDLDVDLSRQKETAK